MLTIIICMVLIGIGVTVFSTASKESSYYGELYVTPTGNKYHKKDCIFIKGKTNSRRMTKEEFESKDDVLNWYSKKMLETPPVEKSQEEDFVPDFGEKPEQESK